MNTRENGFTLIEVLIAVTLLSFVMLGIITVSENSLQTKERVTSEDNKLLQIETALDRLEWDISHMYSPLYFSILMAPNSQDPTSIEAYNNFMNKYQENERFNKVSYESLPIPRNKIDDTAFSFFTLANRRKFSNQKQSSFAWVQYDLSAAENDDQKSIQGTSYLVRQFLADDVFSPSPIPWDKVKKQVLLKNVDSLKFNFWDNKTKKWQESLTTIRNGENIIYGIKIILKIKENEEEIKTIERVYRPLFPYFKSENYYQLVNIKDDQFLSNSQGNLDVEQ